MTLPQPRISLLGSLSVEAEERLAELVDDGGNVRRRKKRKTSSDFIANDTTICDGSSCGSPHTGSPDATLSVSLSEEDDVVEDLDDGDTRQ